MLQPMRTQFLLAATASLALLGLSSPGTAADYDRDDLKKRQRLMRATVHAAQPATVGIVFPQSAGAGSGVIVSQEGLVLTAAHVSGESGRDVTIILPGGERLPGKTLGAYRSLDAGMIQILAENRRFPTVPRGDSASLEIGQWCLAIGHPGGFLKERPAPVRLGRILDKSSNGFILTDSTLVGGDSGGPLLDLEGRLIGIHSSIGYDLAENRHVPIDIFKEHWDTMRAGEVTGDLFDWLRQDVAFLGVVMDPEPDEAPGVRILQIVPKSPAATAGLLANDRVLEVAGKPLTASSELVDAVRSQKPKESLKLTVQSSNAEPRPVTVELVSLREFRRQLEGLSPEEDTSDDPDDSDTQANEGGGFLGVILHQSNRKVTVRQTLPDAPAQRSGIRVGDTVLQCDDLVVTQVDELIRYVGARSPGETIRLLIERGGELKRFNVKLKQRPR